MENNYESILFCYGKFNEEETWLEQLTLEPLNENLRIFNYVRDPEHPLISYSPKLLGFEGSVEALELGLSLYFQMYMHEVAIWKIVVNGEYGFKVFRKLYNTLTSAHAYIRYRPIDLLSIVDYTSNDFNYKAQLSNESTEDMKQTWKYLQNGK